MNRKTLLHVVILSVVCLLGFLSMGFQMVASRLLEIHFGSGLYVWAFLISTFLAAFSLGSMLGGWVSSLGNNGRLLGRVLLAGLAIAGFAVLALYGDPILKVISESIQDEKQGLLAACPSLFLLPVLALSAFSPLTIERLSADGIGAGAASGIVYGVSTLGNILGVMVTAMVLISTFGTAKLLMLWWGVATVVVLLLAWLLKRPKTIS